MKVEWKALRDEFSWRQFEEDVSKHLSDGWELCGPLIPAPMTIQPLIRYSQQNEPQDTNGVLRFPEVPRWKKVMQPSAAQSLPL